VRHILVVDDDRATREAMVDILGAEGHRVDSAAEGQEALAALEEGEYDLVLSDLVVPGLTGLELLEKVRARDPLCQVVMITGYGSVETAVEAMQKGAFHYLTKPVKPLELRSVAQRALEDRRLREENQELHRRLEEVEGPQGMIGSSPSWARILQLVKRVAPTDSTVLVTGESGTGKELVATALHHLSGRSRRPLVKVNCASLVESLLQSELFGHVKGAFTGAVASKKGRFERADGGTIFLDEIGEMSPETQARLLRVLQDGEVEPVGGESATRVDVRVVAATNKNLEEAIKDGSFREDLYYRLKVVRLELPPLRERAEDIPVLVGHFLAELEERYRLGITGIEPDAMTRLRAYPWPGNVRELKNCLEGAIVTCEGNRLRVADLPREIRGEPEPAEGWSMPPAMTLEEMERAAILQTLDRLGGARNETAERLGISVRTLQRKLKQYRQEGHLPPEEDDEA
jgi:two-component system response regulator HydG